MTCDVKNTQFELAMELPIDNGFDGVSDAMSIMMNGAMQISDDWQTGRRYLTMKE